MNPWNNVPRTAAWRRHLLLVPVLAGVGEACGGTTIGTPASTTTPIGTEVTTTLDSGSYIGTPPGTTVGSSDTGTYIGTPPAETGDTGSESP